MPVSKVIISSENIVELAQNTIRPVKCDWTIGHDSCPVVLACWILLKEHLYHHCDSQRKLVRGRTHFECRLPRCNMRIHSSIKSLKNHIESAHLERANVPCPISECVDVSYPLSRRNQLREHFNQLHDTLEGEVVACPTPLLHPIWRPFFPRPMSDPPLLPQQNPSPGTSIISSIAMAEPKGRKKLLNGPIIGENVSPESSFKLARHRQVATITGAQSTVLPSSQLDEEQGTRGGKIAWDFAPLPPLLESDMAAVSVNVQPVLPQSMGLVRPQVMQDFTPMLDLPKSIHYEVLVRKVARNQ